MEEVRNKFNSLALLLSQLDATAGEVIVAQYKYELSRDGKGRTLEDVQRTQQYWDGFESAQRDYNQVEEIILRTTGIETVEEVRQVHLELGILLQAYEETNSELTQRKLLAGIRMESLTEYGHPEKHKEIMDKLQDQIEEIAVLGAQVEAIADHAEYIANDVALTTEAPTRLVTR